MFFFCKPLVLIGLVLIAWSLLFHSGCSWRHCCGGGSCGHGGWHRRGHGDWMVKRIAKALDLNEAQRAKLSSLRDTLMARRADFGNVRSELLTELAVQAKSEKLDTAKLNGLLEEKEAKMKSLHQALLGQIAEFHAMLTPEQRAKLAKKLEKINEWQEKRCHH